MKFVIGDLSEYGKCPLCGGPFTCNATTDPRNGDNLILSDYLKCVWCGYRTTPMMNLDEHDGD